MYLVDTNIIIYHLSNSIPKPAHRKLREIFKRHFNISVITKMEVLGFRKHTDISFSTAQQFLGYAKVLELNEPIVETVIALRRAHKTKLPDAIIAATALLWLRETRMISTVSA
jgi:predicted nucleic acid-binding protein